MNTANSVRRRFTAKALAFMLMLACLLLVLPGLPAQATTNDMTIYPMPSDLPAKYRSTDFTLSANGSEVPVYASGINAWGNTISYASFDSAGSVTVNIGVSFAFTSHKLLPASLGLAGQQQGQTITFTLTGPTDVTLLLDGDYNGRVLHLFVRAPEADVPAAGDANVLYYGPGYHDISAGTPTLLGNGQTLYLAGGAVVRGRFLVNGASNVTVRGRGILMNDYAAGDGYDEVPLVLKNSSHVTVRDIIVTRDFGAWTAFMWKCDNIEVDGYKAVNARYASSDGFNIANCHDVTFNNVFIRTCDDSIAIKGTGNSGYDPEQDPANSPATYNITYQNAQLWSDANNAIGIGAETQAAYFDNITFRNIDVLRNYDDLNYPDTFTDRSAINICALNATTIQNITFEDIRVEKAKRLINIAMEDSFWFGSLPGNWNWPGAIRNITYRNITSTSDGSNQIRFAGWDAAHLIQDVTLENVQINGSHITGLDDSHFSANRFVKDVTLAAPGAETQTGDGPLPAGLEVHSAASEFSQAQGENGWYYRTWKAGVGIREMTWNPDGSNHWRGPESWDAIWKSGDDIYLHPDGTQILLEWTAPKAGSADISGVVRKFATEGGNGVTVSVWKNDQMIWPQNGAWYQLAYNDSTGVETAASTVLAQGDVLSFRVDAFNGDTAYDSTCWTPLITYRS